MSALRRRGEWLELRLLCQQPRPTTAVVTGRFNRAREADLLGRPGPEVSVREGVLELPLGPWELRTVQLAPSS
jgi:alpha-mannosidase